MSNAVSANRPVRVMAGDSSCSTWSAASDLNPIRRICRADRHAEGVGFEPTEARRTSTAFEAVPFVRSGILPVAVG